MGLVTVFVALTFIMGCSRARQDESITTDIKAQLFSDSLVKSARLDVTTKNGIVTLSGTVPDDTARYEAIKIAKETTGVKDVTDQTTNEQSAAAVETPEPVAEPEPPLRAPKPRTVSAARRTEPVHEAAPYSPPPAPAPVASAPAPPPEPVIAAAPAPPPPQPRHVEIPPNTQVRIQMTDGVDSQINRVGETFHATLDAPIVVDNEVVVPAGTDVYVKLADARTAGRFTGKNELSLELTRMEFQGKSYNLESEAYEQAGSSRGKSTATKVGGGAVLGALIGGLAGGGKGAAIGAGVGAGAGTVAQVATHGQQVRIPPETKLDFTITQPVSVSYFPEKNRTRR